MLSRRLTVTISLLVVAIAGCENQGKGAGKDAIVEICDYSRQAIKALGCLSETGSTDTMAVQVEAATTPAAVDQSDYFYQKCLGEHRIVAQRCRDQQAAVAACLREKFDPAKVADAFACQVTEKTVPLEGGAGGAGSTAGSAAGGATVVLTTTVSVRNGDVKLSDPAFCVPVDANGSAVKDANGKTIDPIADLTACSAAIPAGAP